MFVKGVFEMLTIVLRILSIFGIVLLVLLAAAAVFLLLVLFVPVTYRISGAKDAEGFRVSARVRWLLGLVRVRCDYPVPGYLVAKVFLFTLYKTKIPPDEIPNGKDKNRSGNAKGKGRKAEGKTNEGEKTADAAKAEEKKGNSGLKEQSAEQTELRKESAKTGTPKEAVPVVELEMTVDGERADAGEGEGKADSEQQTDAGKDTEEKQSCEEPISIPGKILQKIQKIKYTISSICDKIKKIWDNISYYLELLQEETTRQFLADVRNRSGKMLKNVLPRHIRADIRFGTGSPDTTGYLYGAFCMVSPMLGSKVNVIPDFEKAVFQGEFDISGHVTAVVLLWNLCRMALDRRLRLLIRKARIPMRQMSGKKAV